MVQGGHRNGRLVAVVPNPAFDVTVVTPDAAAGGTTRARVADHAARRGLDLVVVPIHEETRPIYTVVDESRGDVLEVIEPSPTLPADEVTAFERSAAEAIADADVLITGGSLPGGTASTLFAALVRRAHDTDTVAIVDAAGDALLECLTVAPDLIAPNAAEAVDAIGARLPSAVSIADPAEIAERLQRHGAAAACLTAGAEGSVVCTGRESWHVTLEADAAINAVGREDALLGGAEAALAAGMSLKQASVLGTAAAVSNLAHAQPDHIDPEEVRRWQHEVHVETLPRAHADQPPLAIGMTGGGCAR
jgi:fructose-1-phosphate kinase PfkB-like protein